VIFGSGSKEEGQESRVRKQNWGLELGVLLGLAGEILIKMA
jgi:hypothetical protein